MSNAGSLSNVDDYAGLVSTGAIPEFDGRMSSGFVAGSGEPTDCHSAPIDTLMSFGQCLAAHPKRCPYVMFSGTLQFCTHPNWQGLIERKPEDLKR
jgi:hypothetical protein